MKHAEINITECIECMILYCFRDISNTYWVTPVTHRFGDRSASIASASFCKSPWWQKSPRLDKRDDISRVIFHGTYVGGDQTRLKCMVILRDVPFTSALLAKDVDV